LKTDLSVVYLSMDFKTIKNKNHYLYDDIAEFNVSHPDIPVRHNWRHGEQNEWVFTDDGFVCQILRITKVAKYGGKQVPCVRTVCGTYLPRDNNKEMLGEDGIADNIYSFSRNFSSKEDFNERKRNSKQLMFARYITDGYDSVTAYKKAYPDAKEDSYIKHRCDKLLKTEKIDKMISEERRKKLEEEGVTDNWLIERYKTIADMAENDNAKLKSLDSLAKISGLFEPEHTKSEQVTVWAGFSPEQLEEVKKNGKPELIAHAEKESKEETS
jgi:hypothetical protein